MQPAAPELSTSATDMHRWSAFARVFCLLQAELLTLTVAIGYVTNATPIAQLMGQNNWPSADRNRLLVVWAVLALLLTGVSAFAARRFGLARLTRAAQLLLPLIPISLLPFVLCTDHWFHRPLPYLVVLGIFGFITEACLAPALAQGDRLFDWCGRIAGVVKKRAAWLPLGSVILGAVAYVAYTGYLTVLNHHRFGTGAFDLGIFNNVMYNSLTGQPFRTTIMIGEGSTSFLICHSPYLLYAFLPFYALHPTAETLLWLQAVLLGSGAVMLFFFARTQIAASYSAVIALLYLLFAPMHGAQFYDFHWLTVATPFLLFLFYALAQQRVLLICIATVLLWLLREDLAPGLVLLGMILLLSGVRPKAGLLIAMSSALWFALNKFVIMPSFGEWWFANLYEDLTTPAEKGYGSVIKTLLTNPLFVIPTLISEGKFTYLLHMLVPLALIPARHFKLAMFLVPGALFTILTNAGANYSIRYQYSSHYAAYIFAATVIYFRWLIVTPHPQNGAHRAKPLAALAAVALCMICHSTTFGVVLKPSSFIGGSFPIAFSLTEREEKQLAALRSLKQLIPPDASLTATTRDSPHLSSRKYIYAFSHSRHKSEYLLLNPNSFGMGSTNRDILAALSGNDYGLVKKEMGIMLWKRGHNVEQSAGELQRLRRRLGDRSSAKKH